MKKLVVIALMIAAIGSVDAFAQSCPTAPTEVQIFCGGYNYTQSQSCYSSTAGINTASPGCWSSDPAWTFDENYLMYTNTSFVPSSTYMYTNQWTASTFVEFSSPVSSAYDWIELAAFVNHGGSVSRYSLFFWDATMGSLNGCGAAHYGIFNAVAGDTITIQITASNVHGGTIKASVPEIFNDRCN